MGRTVVSRTIDAPVTDVFRVVSEIENYSKAVPWITKVEILTDAKKGVGTKFRETRLMGSKEATTELEVTEFVENERIRLVSDSHGTVWDSVFVTKEVAGKTELTLTMEGKPHSTLAKMMVPMMKPMLEKALAKDMDAVKAFCEK